VVDWGFKRRHVRCCVEFLDVLSSDLEGLMRFISSWFYYRDGQRK
jgi:hypothetical protein